jgi:glycine betaine/proline transport system ATP-binding protein
VGLTQWRNKKPDELSGGMQQRVGLARALAMDADILLMDEPFSALDPLIRQGLQDELLELQRKLSKTIVFVSHDLDEALKLGSRIAIMKDGRIIQYSVPEEIVLNPADDYVRTFVAHTNPLNVLCGRSLMRTWTTANASTARCASTRAATRGWTWPKATPSRVHARMAQW